MNTLAVPEPPEWPPPWCVPALPSMTESLNPFHHPICASEPHRLKRRSWQEHIPFGMFLVDLLRPDILVELGTHYGDSYCAFCQAVKELKLDTRCYAIDTWQGDVHSGFYGPEVLVDLRRHHDVLYGGFSCLVQSTFDEAAPRFDDGRIDLLHIDGCHAYDAVKHDFETWLPKMSPRGVVLLHDISVRDRESYGVWKLWDELGSRYPHFAFFHGHGLGVVALGKDYSRDFQGLLEASVEESESIRAFFAGLGKTVSRSAKRDQERQTLRARAKETQERLHALEGQLAERSEQLPDSSQRLAEGSHEKERLATRLAEQEGLVEDLRIRLADHQRQFQAAVRQRVEQEDELCTVRAQLVGTQEQLQASEVLSAEGAEQLRTLQAQLAASERAAQALRRDLAALERSWTWKIGWKVTWPGRMLKRTMRSMASQRRSHA